MNILLSVVFILVTLFISTHSVEAQTCATVTGISANVSTIESSKSFQCYVDVSQESLGSSLRTMACGVSIDGGFPDDFCPSDQFFGNWSGNRATFNCVIPNTNIKGKDGKAISKVELVGYDFKNGCGPQTGKRLTVTVNNTSTNTSNGNNQNNSNSITGTVKDQLATTRQILGDLLGFFSPSQQNTGTSTSTSTQTVLTPPNLSSYGLPAPSDAGVQQLLKRIQTEENMRWSVEQLLAAEKYVSSKGISIKPYLTTAWVWFENGQSGYPDLYELNCNTNRNLSQVSQTCPTANFQVAGYQAANRAGDYKRLYSQLYSTDQLQGIMQKVVDNSYHAIRDEWKYTSGTQANSTLLQSFLPNGKIPTNISVANITNGFTDFFDPSKQFYTSVVGKDPAMVVALNSFAVSDGDLVNALKGSGYGYIGATEKQLLSNMVTALYTYDQQKNGTTTTTTTSTGTSFDDSDSFITVFFKNNYKNSELNNIVQPCLSNLDVYQKAQQSTGISWIILAGIHYREGECGSNKSLVSGRTIGVNEPDLLGNCSSANAGEGKPVPLSGGGCGFKTLLDSAVYAGNHLKGKIANQIPTKFSELATALSRYNGGGNANCDGTPYTNCPKKYYGDDDTYVMNIFDKDHDPMYVVYCADNTKCNPAKKDSRPGTATAMRIIGSSFQQTSGNPQNTTQNTTQTAVQRIAVIGDSISTGSYPSLLAQKLNIPASNIDVFARIGVTTSVMKSTYLPLIKNNGKKYDVAIVFGGVNDLASGISINEIESNLNEIFKNLKQDGIKIIAVSVLPWKNYNNTSDTVTINQTRDLNNLIKNDSQKDTFIDAYQAFNDQVTDGALRSDYNGGDNLHPNAVGQAALADIIYQRIKTQ